MTWINKGVVTHSTPIMNQDFVRNILGINIGTAGGTSTTTVTFTKWEDDTTGKTILVPSIYQLSSISWKTLKTTGCLDGTKSINIEGVEYSVYLPTGGLSDKEIGEVDYFGIFDGAYSIPSGNYVLCKDEIDSINVRMRRKDVWTKTGIDFAGAGLYILLLLKNENGFPIISQGSEDLGDISKFENINYTVTEPDGEKFSLVEQLDGNNIKTLSDQTDGSFVLDLSNHWEQLYYGKHVVEIIATDVNNKQNKTTITFNKVKDIISTIPTDSNLLKAVNHMEELKKEIEYQNFRLSSTLQEKGLEVSSEDKMSSLIDKIQEITVFNIPQWIEIKDTWFRAKDMTDPRNFATSQIFGNDIYVIGGRNGSSSTQNKKNECYNTKLNTWYEKSPMPNVRSNMTSSKVNGKFYLIGGVGSGGWTDINECYDPITDTWTTKQPMAYRRSDIASSCADGKIYVLGGSNSSSTGDRLSYNECYDPLTDTWTTKKYMGNSRYGLSATTIDNKIYAMGGYNGNFLQVNECYDPITDTWTTKKAMPTARRYHVSSILDDSIHIIGGQINGGRTLAHEVYDPKTDTWTTLAETPVKMTSSVSESIDNCIYVIGTVEAPYYERSYCYIK